MRSKVVIAQLVFLLTALIWLRPVVVLADPIEDYLNSLSGQSSTSTSTSTTSDSTTTTSSDPLKDYLQFDPAKNGSGLTSITKLVYLSGADDPVTITYRVINIALSFLGVISTIIILYAGFVWFTSRDNEEKVTQAKQILLGAVIGLFITLGALSLSLLLFYAVSAATGNA